MASNQLVRGRVKAVPSGDTLVIMTMRNNPSEIPPERTITLSSIRAPILARKGGKQSTDEPFAWESREFLRKLCIGKEVGFQVDYTLPPKGKEFGSVFFGNKNIAGLVVAQGWAKVREVGGIERNKGECSPHLKALRKSGREAKDQGVGLHGMAPGTVRNLPPSAVDEPNYWYAMDFLDENRGRSMEAIVEHVRDGSTLHVYLLPDYQHVRVFVAGVQAPLIRNWIVEPRKTEGNGKTFNSSSDTFGRESKHFTELRVLHRDVRIVLEDVDKLSGHLIGSVHYRDGEQTKDLALQLVQNGLAKYVDWSAYMLDDDVKQQLKQSELAAKKSGFRMWTNYMPPPTTSGAVENQNFTGKVVKVVSGDCIVVAPKPSSRRRVYLSSIRCPRLVNGDKGEAAPYAREAKEFMRKHLIGREVFVELEYSRKAAQRLMDFGSIFVESQSRNAEDAPPALSANIGEMMVACGFAEVTRHRDSEARSNHYDALLAAEFRARTAREGMHSGEDAPVTSITDFLTGPNDEARHFLRYIQHRRINAVVEYVFSGHDYKLYIPEEKCNIAFSLSCVRCPGQYAPYYSEAIAQAETMIMQRDVEIEVEDVDETGTFLGSLWESDSNVAMTLLERGLAWLQTSPNADGKTDLHKLEHAEQSAKRQKLKIWENCVKRQDVSNGQAIKRKPKEKLQTQKNSVEGQEVSNGKDIKRKPKQELQVLAKEVLGGGKFYVQLAKDQKAASKIQQQLASLKPDEAPVIGSHNYNKGDLVIAQFSEDNSWNRAMIVNVPQGAVRSIKAKFEVFYIDYGTQEAVAYSRLRPIDCYSVPSLPGLAHLCSLAHVKVPSWEEDYGKEASCCLSSHILHGGKTFKAIVEERDACGGEVGGHGTGTILSVTLIDTEANISINAVMLKKGLARLDTKRWEDAEVKHTIIDDELEKSQEEARKKRLGMWEKGDITTSC